MRISLGDLLDLSKTDEAAAKKAAEKLVIPLDPKIHFPDPDAKPDLKDPDYYPNGFYPDYFPSFYRKAELESIMPAGKVNWIFNNFCHTDPVPVELQKGPDFTVTLGFVDRESIDYEIKMSDMPPWSTKKERLLENRIVMIGFFGRGYFYSTSPYLKSSAVLDEEKPILVYTSKLVKQVRYLMSPELLNHVPR